jgi:hypothetical protein
MNPGISDFLAPPKAPAHTLGHYFLKPKLTDKTAMTKAAAMAIVPWV